MLWIFGGDYYQIQTPDALAGALKLPLVVVATKSDGIAVYMTYPRVRLLIFAVSVAIGALMWLALNRTRSGLMDRAGVDDHDMLSAISVRIQVVFALVFAFGAGLAGFAGCGGRYVPIAGAGRGHPLPDGLAGGRSCGRHGEHPGRPPMARSRAMSGCHVTGRRC